jgi:hypothetical protein
MVPQCAEYAQLGHRVNRRSRQPARAAGAPPRDAIRDGILQAETGGPPAGGAREAEKHDPTPPIRLASFSVKDLVLFTLLGLGSGAFIAGLALSAVLSYRGAGVVNLASGAIAMLGAYVFYGLRLTGALLDAAKRSIGLLGPVARGVDTC